MQTKIKTANSGSGDADKIVSHICYCVNDIHKCYGS